MIFLMVLLAVTMPPFYSVRSAARDFFAGQVSPWTIRSWLRTGRLRGQKAGSRVLIPREELEKFMTPRPINSNGGRRNAK
jgi:excisionase family DNA binding protein